MSVRANGPWSETPPALSGVARGVREVALDELRLWSENPRRISEDRLAQLMRTLAEDREMLRARPLIALPDGTVIAGNQRLLAAQRLRWSTIPTIVVDLD